MDPIEHTGIDPSAPTGGQVDEYRELAGDIASGVGVVAVRSGRFDVAATVTGFLDVSYDPPTMLVSLYADGRIGEAVGAADHWALSLLGSTHRAAAAWLASPSTPLPGLLATVPHSRTPNAGCAVVDGCLAWFELRTTAVHRAATHLLVVGEVVAMGRGAADADDPLVHFARGYRRLAP